MAVRSAFHRNPLAVAYAVLIQRFAVRSPVHGRHNRIHIPGGSGSRRLRKSTVPARLASYCSGMLYAMVVLFFLILFTH
jgi:hypothetical protein